MDQMCLRFARRVTLFALVGGGLSLPCAAAKVFNFSGTMVTTYQVIDLLNPGSDPEESTQADVLIEIAQPIQTQEGHREDNPFHLYIAMANPGQSFIPGQIGMISAVLQPVLNPPPYFIVQQYWNFQTVGTDSFTGQRVLPVTVDPNNFVVTKTFGGPMSMPPNNVWEASVGMINQGAVINGRYDQATQTLTITIEGTAGGYMVGPTAMTTFAFRSAITATPIALDGQPSFDLDEVDSVRPRGKPGVKRPGTIAKGRPGVILSGRTAAGKSRSPRVYR